MGFIDEGAAGGSPRHRVLIVTSGLPMRDLRALAAIADLRVVELSTAGDDMRTTIDDIPVRRILFLPGRPWTWSGVRRTLEAAASDSDIVHTIGAPALLPYARHRPTAAWVHTEDAAEVPRRGVRKPENRPDRLVAASTPIRSALLDAVGGDVQVIPHVVDMPGPRPRPARSADGILNLVGVGGLRADRDPITAVAATAELRRRGFDARLTWVGDGALGDEMRDVAAAGQVPLVLTGRIDRHAVPAVLADADVFILPDRAEASGVAALEALASGRPVVVRDPGAGVDEIVPPRGRVATGQTGAAYADAVEGVLLDSEVLSAEQIAAPVRARYSADAVAGGYARIYAELAGGRETAEGR